VDQYLTANDVALLLQLSLQTIRRYTMNKEIPFHKMNRAVRYKKSEIEKWFEKRLEALGFPRVTPTALDNDALYFQIRDLKPNIVDQVNWLKPRSNYKLHRRPI
jgi:excisionase family DNA binding protein